MAPSKISESSIIMVPLCLPLCRRLILRGRTRCGPKQVDKKKIMAEYFLIPQELEYNLLPSPYLSMAKMIESPLPLQSTAITSFQLVRAQLLAIPDAKTIYKLLECSRRRVLDGFRSVIYSHVGGAITHFPLKILAYWDAVSTLKRDAWARRRKSQQWVNSQKKSHPPNRTIIISAGDVLRQRRQWRSCIWSFPL
ncbi:hypothetical protein C8R45DRAFT_1019829 [Mycena sanguinolenta]|nr:hypothetical protein C8R45DRAFT_1019829 [Mycena sanguinolenta]